MEKQTKSPKEIRQRKFLLVLPLLALPFMTMAFWALGGGKVAEAQATDEQAGFNLKLPGADFKEDKPMDKLSYYDQAQRDSIRFLELMKNDPTYGSMAFRDTDDYLTGEDDRLFETESSQRLNTSVYGGGRSNDPNADRIYGKLAELDRELKRPVADPMSGTETYQTPARYGSTSMGSADVDRLEKMMEMMNQPEAPDPELQQLSGMLEKILDVQHPERVQEKLKQVSETRKGQVFAVSSKVRETPVSLLDAIQTETPATNGFYSLDDLNLPADSQNAIQAVIHETQTIVDGSTVKLRLVNDVFINGIHIPKDNFLFGTASLNGERLNIKIGSLRYGNSLFPVELAVYDMDGLDGIYIPGAITRDVAKQSADRSMQAIGLTSLDPSWQAQAAGAGIEAAKTLFSKKVKLVKVTVKAGYQVLLRDEKQKQSN
ncbi:conjugative transposon protein TraM [Chitinophaga defluvii]|uniref:Conjugative transposon protein TraM n=1 Tax=Chitinophaga defluvii TaxID=3163343 RepID=A0ABV2T6M3_9BACT